MIAELSRGEDRRKAKHRPGRAAEQTHTHTHTHTHTYTTNDVPKERVQESGEHRVHITDNHISPIGET